MASSLANYYNLEAAYGSEGSVLGSSSGGFVPPRIKALEQEVVSKTRELEHFRRKADDVASSAKFQVEKYKRMAEEGQKAIVDLKNKHKDWELQVATQRSVYDARAQADAAKIMSLEEEVEAERVKARELENSARELEDSARSKASADAEELAALREGNAALGTELEAAVLAKVEAEKELQEIISMVDPYEELIRDSTIAVLRQRYPDLDTAGLDFSYRIDEEEAEQEGAVQEGTEQKGAEQEGAEQEDASVAAVLAEAVQLAEEAAEPEQSVGPVNISD